MKKIWQQPETTLRRHYVPFELAEKQQVAELAHKQETQLRELTEENERLETQIMALGAANKELESRLARSNWFGAAARLREGRFAGGTKIRWEGATTLVLSQGESLEEFVAIAKEFARMLDEHSIITLELQAGPVSDFLAATRWAQEFPQREVFVRSVGGQ